ncbi:MAG: hypothetical protein IIY05_02655, partial [Alistipes sp.]|nr:hypothetical protein [Alistipes sp.]
MLERWACNQMDHMSIVVNCQDEVCKKIRAHFQKRDEALGDSMHNRKALFNFVQGLERIPHKLLEENYLLLASMILNKAQVLDEMEDYDLAQFEKWLIKSLIGGNVTGNVLNAQAKSPFLAATYSKANILTVSAGPNAEFDSMVSYLITKGNGCDNVNCIASERPFTVDVDGEYDLVIMNRAAHNRHNQHSDWHDCLKNIKDKFSDSGRFVGVVENKYLFAMLDKQTLFQECVNSKELDTVVLLPKKYGYSIVALNKAKKNPDIVKFVNLYNESLSVHESMYYKYIVKGHSAKANIALLQRAQFKIARFFDYKLPEIEGFELVPLRKFLRRITPLSSFGVNNSGHDDEVYVIQHNQQKPYNPYDVELNPLRVNTFSLYDKYYYLDDCSLIVNRSGALKAHLYDGTYCPAYVKDVLAFHIQRHKILPKYIINELSKPYIQTQLEHWTSSPYGIHSEDEILDLRIYIPCVPDPIAKEEKVCEGELDQNILPNGKTIMSN